jgi:hypothetical protein
VTDLNNYTGSTVELLDWNVLDGGLDNSLDVEILGDVIDCGSDVVLPGPNKPPLYTIIDGEFDCWL